jgi:hypothetical protein
MCDLLGRLIDLTPRSRLPEKNYTPNYPIPSTYRLDYKFREIHPNPIMSIRIPRIWNSIDMSVQLQKEC